MIPGIGEVSGSRLCSAKWLAQEQRVRLLGRSERGQWWSIGGE